MAAANNHPEGLVKKKLKGNYWTHLCIMKTLTQNERPNMVESYEKAMDIIKEYKDILKTNKKNIIFFAFH